MAVTVRPEKFAMVSFDRSEIERLVTEAARIAGVGDSDIILVIDESTQTSRCRIKSVVPIELEVEGGALEDLRYLQQLSPDRVVDTVGRLLFQVADMLDPAFGAPELGADIGLAHAVAWEAYALGRLERSGHDSQRQRRLFGFRNRHGFTDVADAAFERLWSGQGLTWQQVAAISDSTVVAAA